MQGEWNLNPSKGYQFRTELSYEKGHGLNHTKTSTPTSVTSDIERKSGDDTLQTENTASKTSSPEIEHKGDDETMETMKNRHLQSFSCSRCVVYTGFSRRSDLMYHLCDTHAMDWQDAFTESESETTN